jgi:hypothetical protein
LNFIAGTLDPPGEKQGTRLGERRGQAGQGWALQKAWFSTCRQVLGQ